LLSEERKVRPTAGATSLTSCDIELKLDCVAIIAPTRSETTAKRVSRYRTPLPIVALIAKEKVANQLARLHVKSLFYSFLA